MNPDYSQLRKISWVTIFVFLALQLLWIVRFVRVGNLQIRFLKPFSEMEISVLLEHFVAGWGVPALASAIVALLLSRPSWLAKNHSWYRQSLFITYFGLAVAVSYLVFEFSHEVEQLILWKQNTNYWGYVKHCLSETNTEIVAFSKCTAGYRDTELMQLWADLSGVVFFLIISLLSHRQVFDKNIHNENCFRGDSS